MRADRLPDVVVNVSLQPSFLADFLVKERGYRILEIPFPRALALRLGWIADATILAYAYAYAYAYGADPPVPEQDIKTIGVNLHPLSNAKVPPRAIHAVLDALYSPAVRSRLRMPLNEADIAPPSGFPLSAGTSSFLARNEPLVSGEMVDQFKAGVGLLVSLVSVLLIVVRWFRGQPVREEFDDADIKNRIAAMENSLLDRSHAVDRAELDAMDRRLTELKTGVLERMEELRLAHPSLVATLPTAESGARARLSALAGQPAPTPVPVPA